MALARYIRYVFLSDGSIGGTSDGYFDDAKTSLPPEIGRSGELICNAFIPGIITQTFSDGRVETIYDSIKGGGWAFILDKGGNPTIGPDGNYLMSPPPFHVSEPDTNTYILAGMVRRGDVNPLTDLHPEDVDLYNWMLNGVGMPILNGTELKPMPIRTALTDCSNLITYKPPIG